MSVHLVIDGDDWYVEDYAVFRLESSSYPDSIWREYELTKDSSDGQFAKFLAKVYNAGKAARSKEIKALLQ